MTLWELHKPRVWRLRGQRCRCTVCPSYERREWLWVVERSNRLGTFELARGRCRKLEDAREVGALVLAHVDLLESKQHHARYLGAGA